MLDLRLIASRCKNSYYAPRRFSAVQLASVNPDAASWCSVSCILFELHYFFVQSLFVVRRHWTTGWDWNFSPQLHVLLFCVHNVSSTRMQESRSIAELCCKLVLRIKHDDSLSTQSCCWFLSTGDQPWSFQSARHAQLRRVCQPAQLVGPLRPQELRRSCWRPAGESICCEICGTGRANLPGSVVERQLQESLSRMFPELLRFSSSSRLLPLVL